MSDITSPTKLAKFSSLLLHFFAIIWHYLYRGLLIITAYSLNKSFLIYPPNQIFPITISPPWNNTIHSFRPTSKMAEHFHPHYPISSPRRWLTPEKLFPLLPTEDPSAPAIILDGNLSGPPLREGILFRQRHHLVYVDKEFGRWPSRDNFIATYAISIPTNVSFRLFLPVQMMDHCGLYDEAPYSPFRRTIPLIKSSPRPFCLKSPYNSFSSPV